MRTESEHIIRFDSLEIGYRQGRKKNVLCQPLDCVAREGELIALMGRNGSGKSTLLRTLAGLQDPLGGKILLGNRSLSDYPGKELARLLGFVSTEVVRVQGLKVRNLVAMGRYPHTGWFGSLAKPDHEMIDRAIEITSLGDLRERDLDELSDGERQRAMIARTLAQDTRILVLDEPTAFLDLGHRYEIIALLGGLARNHGKTIVFSSHDLQISLQQADKIWIMHEQNIFEGAPEDLILNGQLELGLMQNSRDSGFAMDPNTGDLVVVRTLHHPVSLSGESDELKVWTRRALMRMGFRVEENKKQSLHVLVDRKDGNPRWIVEKGTEKIELNSIYNLSLYLRTIV